MPFLQQREWDPQSFFRHMTPGVIEMFSRRAKIPFAPDREQPPWSRLYEGWRALDRGSHERLLSHLLRMNDMSYVHARPYLARVAKKVWTNGKSYLLEESRDWSAQDLAMRLYMDNREAFLKAYRTYCIDTVQHAREYRGRYERDIGSVLGLTQPLENHLQSYFRDAALGGRCKVEDHTTNDKLAIFVYYEDEVTPRDQFTEEGVLAPDWRREVQHVFAVFYYQTYTLRVKAPRKADAEKLRDLFALFYVGDSRYFEDPSSVPRFRFEVLRDRGSSFPTNPRDEIEEVKIVSVDVECRGGPIRGLTLDLHPGVSVADLNEALDYKGLDREGAAITGVDMRLRFAGKGNSRFRTISINNRGTTNLDDTPRDVTLRHYLKVWKIDALP